MSRIDIVPPAGRHLDRIAALMNPLDVQEVWASRGLAPKPALEESVALSYSTRVVLVNGAAQAAFGIATNHEGAVGVPWMLATPEILAWPTRFLLTSLRVMQLWKRDHPLLSNYSDARHVETHRWLRWLGFRFVELHPEFGHARLPFWRFECVTPLSSRSPSP